MKGAESRRNIGRKYENRILQPTPAEPKCECGHDRGDHHNEGRFCCDVPEAANYCQAGECSCESYRPPTTEPAESEGKWACKECGTVKADGGGHHPACPMRPYGYTPPAESVEDRAREVANQESRLGMIEDYLVRFAQAELERQTPAIIEKAFDEWQEWMHYNGYFASLSPEFLAAMGRAMQTVKARRSGGEK